MKIKATKDNILFILELAKTELTNIKNIDYTPEFFSIELFDKTTLIEVQ